MNGIAFNDNECSLLLRDDLGADRGKSIDLSEAHEQGLRVLSV